MDSAYASVLPGWILASVDTGHSLLLLVLACATSFTTLQALADSVRSFDADTYIITAFGVIVKWSKFYVIYNWNRQTHGQTKMTFTSFTSTLFLFVSIDWLGQTQNQITVFVCKMMWNSSVRTKMLWKITLVQRSPHECQEGEGKLQNLFADWIFVVPCLSKLQ